MAEHYFILFFVIKYLWIFNVRFINRIVINWKIMHTKPIRSTSKTTLSWKVKRLIPLQKYFLSWSTCWWVMNFFIWRKNVLFSRYLDFCVSVKSTDFKICNHRVIQGQFPPCLKEKILPPPPITFPTPESPGSWFPLLKWNFSSVATFKN